MLRLAIQSKGRLSEETTELLREIGIGLDDTTLKVLMLGYMNREAFEKTSATGLVTFWSRGRECLWTKGETSGNYLHVVSMLQDCDNDTLLVRARPEGSYTTRLFLKGPKAISKKVVEEAGETIIEAVDGNRSRFVIANPSPIMPGPGVQVRWTPETHLDRPF